MIVIIIKTYCYVFNTAKMIICYLSMWKMKVIKLFLLPLFWAIPLFAHPLFLSQSQSSSQLSIWPSLPPVLSVTVHRYQYKTTTIAHLLDHRTSTDRSAWRATSLHKSPTSVQVGRKRNLVRGPFRLQILTCLSSQTIVYIFIDLHICDGRRGIFLNFIRLTARKV